MSDDSFRPTVVEQNPLDFETHGLGAHLRFDGHGLSPYWGVVSVYEPDHDETLEPFDALGETWLVDSSKHWAGQLAPPDEANGIDGGMNEYQYQLVADDEAGDKDLTLQFRAGFPNAENIHSGNPIQGIPDELPECLRVQVMSTNLDVDEILPLVMAFADHVGLNPDYFADPHESSTAYQLERYARLVREIAEQHLTGDGGLLDQLADFASGESGRGMYKWDHEDVQAHYEAVAFDPETWACLIPDQRLGKQLKCYHPQHVRDAASSDPLSDPKVEISLSSEYDPDGTVPWHELDDAIQDLDEAVLNVLHWAGVPVQPDDEVWNADDPYFDVDAAADSVTLRTNPLPDLREATQDLVKEEMVARSPTDTEEQLLLALTDGGSQRYDDLAERVDASTSSVYRLLDKFEALLDSENGIVQFADELTREHVSEIVQPLRDTAEWAGEALRQAVDHERILGGDGESALEQWMQRHGIELVDAGTRLRFKLGRPVAKRKLVKMLRAGLEAAEASGFESDFRAALIDWRDADGEPRPGWNVFVGDRPLGESIYRY